MCGIFGVIAKKESLYSKDLLKKTVERIAVLSESRGKDSSGIAFRNENTKTISVLKGPIPISDLLNDDLFINKLNDNLLFKNSNSKFRLEANFSLFGHARLVTNGTQLEDENNQPVVKDGAVGIHNGIIVNVDDLWGKNNGLKRNYEIDTEVMLSLVRNYSRNENSLSGAVSKSINDIFGTVATAMFFDDNDEFILATNNGSLYILTNFEDILIFASERYILSKLVH